MTKQKYSSTKNTFRILFWFIVFLTIWFLLYYGLFLFEDSSKSKIDVTFCIGSEPVMRTILDTNAQNILLIGDSQAYFLMKGFTRYTNLNKHKLTAVSWVSATIDIFAKTDTLNYYLDSLKPSFVVITLGTNQLPFNDSIRIKNNLDQLQERLKLYKTVWVSPLKRKRSIGLNKIFKKEIDQFCLFLSDSLEIPRKSGDWAHPSSKGSEIWVDSIVSWIKNKSKYPIYFDINENKNTYNFSKIVLKPYQE